jgi:hypothetical protein
MSRNEQQPQVALFIVIIVLIAVKLGHARVKEKFDCVRMIRQFTKHRNDEIAVPGLDARIRLGILIRELEDAWLTAQVAVWEKGAVFIDKFRHIRRPSGLFSEFRN